MYGPTQPVPTVEFTRAPNKFRKPCAGNLYVTDIPFGRVFRVSPADASGRLRR
jgi:hypothetical protein